MDLADSGSSVKINHSGDVLLADASTGSISNDEESSSDGELRPNQKMQFYLPIKMGSWNYVRLPFFNGRNTSIHNKQAENCLNFTKSL